MAQVDIEPDHPSYRFINVTFRNCSFLNNQGGGIDLTTAKMDDSSQPISISFDNITVKGGPLASPTSCGVSLTGHMYPHENVRGHLQMNNIRVSDTPSAGLRMTR